MICKQEFIFHLFLFCRAFLLWLCHNLYSRMELQNQVVILLLSMLFLCCLLYLVVVEEVYDDLHDAWEDHQDSAADEEGVDVVKWLILLLFGSWYKFEYGMSGSDLVACNHDTVLKWTKTI